MNRYIEQIARNQHKTQRKFILMILCCWILGFSDDGLAKDLRISHDFVKKAFHEFLILDYLGFSDDIEYYSMEGWSNSEKNRDETFAWSLGKKSSLKFYVIQPKKLDISIKCEPLKVQNKQQTMEVLVNNRYLTKLFLKNRKKRYKFTIPEDYLDFGDNIMTFKYAYCRTPKSLKMNEDKRCLGVCFYDIYLDKNLKNFVFKDYAMKLFGTAVEINISRIKIGKEVKIGYIHNPKTGFGFNKCYIPPNSTLKFSLGFHPRVKSIDSDVVFSIILKEFNPHSRQRSQIIFSESLNLKADIRGTWKNYAVDLSHFAGKIVTINFAALADVDPYKILAVWGEPKICTETIKSNYNTIFITFDALRKDHVGCYGYEKETTPNINRFSEDSVIFNNCRSVSPWTLPSFASIYTSLYPKTHKVGYLTKAEKKVKPLRMRFPTPPSFLKPYGYYTRIITWHAFFDRYFGLSRDFDDRDGDKLNTKKTLFIDDIKRSLEMNKKERFFFHMHILPPHGPYYAVHPYDESFVDFSNTCLDGSMRLSFHDEDIKYYKAYLKQIGKEPAIKSYIVNLYDAGLALADEFFGRIIDVLKELDLYDDTLIIFSSDHGEQFWEHGDMLHGRSVYEEELQIPFIIKFPKEFNIKSQEIDFPIFSIDILPTILEVNGIMTSQYFHGKSFFCLEKKKLKSIKRNYSYFFQYFNSPDNGYFEGVRWDNFKYIYSAEKKSEELYDLENDPYEKINIGMKRPDILEKLRTGLKNYDEIVSRKKEIQIGWEKMWEIEPAREDETHQAPQIDDETMKKLRELGYVK